MKLITTKCPHCGGAMQIDEQFKKAVCPFCETVLIGRSKLPLVLKIILLAMLWGLVVLVAIANL